MITLLLHLPRLFPLLGGDHGSGQGRTPTGHTRARPPSTTASVVYRMFIRRTARLPAHGREVLRDEPNSRQRSRVRRLFPARARPHLCPRAHRQAVLAPAGHPIPRRPRCRWPWTPRAWCSSTRPAAAMHEMVKSKYVSNTTAVDVCSKPSRSVEGGGTIAGARSSASCETPMRAASWRPREAGRDLVGKLLPGLDPAGPE
jgi:hypothetical protein